MKRHKVKLSNLTTGTPEMNSRKLRPIRSEEIIEGTEVWCYSFKKWHKCTVKFSGTSVKKGDPKKVEYVSLFTPLECEFTEFPMSLCHIERVDLKEFVFERQSPTKGEKIPITAFSEGSAWSKLSKRVISIFDFKLIPYFVSSVHGSKKDSCPIDKHGEDYRVSVDLYSDKSMYWEFLSKSGKLLKSGTSVHTSLQHKSKTCLEEIQVTYDKFIAEMELQKAFKHTSKVYYHEQASTENDA